MKNSFLKTKKSKQGFLIFILITIVSVFLICWQKFSTNSPELEQKENFFNSKIYSLSKNFAVNKKNGYIALVKIEGVIEEENKTYNQEWILSVIEKLKNDDKNKGILLYINSPGGSVYCADALYLKLLDYKTANKKLYAYFGPMAASGGYYIACAAEKIFANRNTLTGSIGVIAGNSVDMTDFLGKLGIKITTFTAGKNKNMLNIDSPLTEEQKNIMLSIANEAYNQFVDIVVTGRNLEKETILPICDGRILTAQQALHHKLIDSISEYEKVLDALQEEYPEISFIDCNYEKKESIYDMFTTIKTKQHKETQIYEILEKNLPPETIGYPAYYFQQ